MGREVSINRRRLTRFPAELNVRVFLRGQWVGDYRTRDVSRAGIGLKPGGVMLWQGLHVEVQLYSPVGRQAIPRRIPAQVRYCRAGGMGVRFGRRGG